MLTTEAKFLEDVKPHVAGTSVLLVGHGPWLREGVLLKGFQSFAETVTMIEPYALIQGERRGVYDAVVFAPDRLYSAAEVAPVAALLREGGIFVADAFTPDQFDERTLNWWVERLRERGIERTPRELRQAWEFETNDFTKHESYESLRRALDEHFNVRHFEWLPAFDEGDVFEAEDLPDELWNLEGAAVARGEIAGLGFRYVGERRS